MQNYWDAVCQTCPAGTDCTLCIRTANQSHKIKLGVLLANSIRRSLRDGVRHYNEDGELLTTASQIIDTFQNDGVVIVEEPPEDFGYAI